MTTIVAISGAVFVASLIAIAVGYPSWMWALVLVTFWGPIVIVPTAGVAALVGRARRRAGATAFSRRYQS